MADDLTTFALLLRYNKIFIIIFVISGRMIIRKVVGMKLSKFKFYALFYDYSILGRSYLVLVVELIINVSEQLTRIK